MRKHNLFLATLLLASAAAYSAGVKGDGAVDSAAAFGRLKTLVGEWQSDTKMGKTHLTYELIAGGTVLVERESGEKMPVMLTMYHLDGNRLMLTHYCAAGNQPRMQARSFDPNTGELRFQFLDATNLSKDAGHMRNATFRFVDNQHFSGEWEFYEGGRLKNSESFEYTRIK